MKMGSIYLLVCFQATISVCFGLTSEELAMFKSRTYINKNTGLQGKVSIQENDGNTLLITTNGIPDHATGKFDGSHSGPNYIEEQTTYFVIPKVPELTTEEPGCLPMGPIGIALNGIAIYNPYTLTCCDAGQVELNLFDECWGHPSPQNSYHYHTAPLCLMRNYCNKPSSIVGVAFDGFPIYGPFDEDGNELTSADLDECNGKKTRDGSYRYHVTGDFPYFLNCYKGKVISQTGIRTNCKCTEPKFPCDEFAHHATDDDKHASNKSLNEQLGLRKDGHFYCCEEDDDENCPFTTNVNSGIESATGRVQNTGNNALGLMMGFGNNNGQQGQRPPPPGSNNNGQQGTGNSHYGSNAGRQGGQNPPSPAPGQGQYGSQGLNSAANSKPQPKNNNLFQSGGESGGVASKPRQNNFLFNLRQGLQKLFGFNYNPTRPSTSTQPTGQGAMPAAHGSSTSGQYKRPNENNSGQQGGSHPRPNWGPKPRGIGHGFMGFLGRGFPPKGIRPGQQGANAGQQGSKIGFPSPASGPFGSSNQPSAFQQHPRMNHNSQGKNSRG